MAAKPWFVRRVSARWQRVAPAVATRREDKLASARRLLQCALHLPALCCSNSHCGAATALEVADRVGIEGRLLFAGAWTNYQTYVTTVRC